MDRAAMFAQIEDMQKESANDAKFTSTPSGHFIMEKIEADSLYGMTELCQWLMEHIANG